MGNHEGKEEVQVFDQLRRLLLYCGEDRDGRNPRKLLVGRCYCCCLPFRLTRTCEEHAIE